MKPITTLITALILGMTLAGCSTNSSGNTASSTSNSLPAADEQNVHMCLMGGGHDCDIILNPANKATYGDAVQKVCNMMPMPACKSYFQ